MDTTQSPTGHVTRRQVVYRNQSLLAYRKPFRFCTAAARKINPIPFGVGAVNQIQDSVRVLPWDARPPSERYSTILLSFCQRQELQGAISITDRWDPTRGPHSEAFPELSEEEELDASMGSPPTTSAPPILLTVFTE